MTPLNETHDPNLTSWVASANDGQTDFPIQNLPFAIFRRQGSSEAWRGGVAIGDQIVDMAAAVQAGVFNAHTFVWLLRDPNAQLGSAAAQAIVAGLNVQLREQGWQIQTLEAREDHLYLMADVPGDTPSHEVIRDLKRRSAEIAHTQEPMLNADDLWADGYLVVTPGRALDEEEIQQFINFERMP
mgnify:CR=1 FL=1